MSQDSLQPNAEKKAIGSTFILRAKSYEPIKEFIENDPYYTTDVVSEFTFITPFPNEGVPTFRLSSGTKRNL